MNFWAIAQLLVLPACLILAVVAYNYVPSQTGWVLASIGGYCALALAYQKIVEHRRGWRVVHVGRSGIRYEERNDNGAWRGLDFIGDMLIGAKPHHWIGIESEEDWQAQRPDWAKGRRALIVARVKQQCPKPGYQYTEPE